MAIAVPSCRGLDQPGRGPARARPVRRSRALLSRGARNHGELVRQGALQDGVESDDAGTVAAHAAASRRGIGRLAPRRRDSGARVRTRPPAGRVSGQRSGRRRAASPQLRRSRGGIPAHARLYTSVYGTKHYLIGIAISNIGSVYSARNDHKRAEPFYREAIAMYDATSESC